MLKASIVAMAAVMCWNSAAQAESAAYPPAKVSFSDYKNLVTAVESHRAKRLVSFDRFMEMSRDPQTIILDTRSVFRFDRLHLKGAKHLSFTDFTQENLAKIIPSFETRILIYCNNNFDGNQVDFPSKIAFPKKSAVSSQIAAQEKPVMMALNIPTYINLFGYGYKNVYELDELVDVKSPRVQFEGTLVGK